MILLIFSEFKYANVNDSLTIINDNVVYLFAESLPKNCALILNNSNFIKCYMLLWILLSSILRCIAEENWFRTF